MGHERTKIVKIKVENGQKVFTACRRGLKVCGWKISMSRLIIDQFVTQNDLFELKNSLAFKRHSVVYRLKNNE